MPKKNEKHSAYRSMKMGTGKPKKGNKSLLDWGKEEWKNLTPSILGDNNFYECGTQSIEQKKLKLPSVCRPTKKVNNKTPKLAQSYTKEQIKKAVEIKKKGKTINWSKL